jgi:enolase
MSQSKNQATLTEDSIKSIKCRQILDSRGNPTIEVDTFTHHGFMGRASVPSGASTGSREALELRDQDPTIFQGKSVMKALSHINEVIAPKLIGLKVTDQKSIDELMINLDGTEYKSKLGANAILGVSLSASRAGALSSQLPLYRYLKEVLGAPNKTGKYLLPKPLMNIINGGEHASNNLDIQEFMIVPSSGENFARNLRMGVEIFHSLKKVLTQKNLSTNVGDEGGFAPELHSHEEALDLILEAAHLSGYKCGKDFYFALDSASSEFFDEEKLNYQMQGKTYTTDQMIDYYQGLLAKYPLMSIEDGLAESDQNGWKKLTEKLGKKVKLVGDDLFVTNKKILKKGIEEKWANSILIKLNQIGTLTETFQTMKLAFENNFDCIISHRSGETADHFISDLAVATAAGFIKTGSASRSDRTEKYNQLLRIEEEI